MEKDKIKNLKELLIGAVKDPMGTCVLVSFYIISLAVGIWILGFALSFLIKIMRPIIFLT